MEHIVLKIPVKPHIQKFLNALFTDHYVLNDKDLLGTLLINILRSQRYNREEKANPQVYSKYYTVKIPFRYYEKSGLDSYIKQKAAIDFNRIIGGFFRMLELYGVDCQLNYNPKQQKQAFELVHSIFGINENDLSEESLRKAYQRYKVFKSSNPYPNLTLSHSSIPEELTSFLN